MPGNPFSTAPGSGPSFVPYTSGNGWQNYAINAGMGMASNIAGSALSSVPFFGQAAKFGSGVAYDYATTGNANLKGNLLAMVPFLGGFLKNKFSPASDPFFKLEALPGSGFAQNVLGLKPADTSVAPYSDFLASGGGWMQGSMYGGFNLPAPSPAWANYTGDPLSLLFSQLFPQTTPAEVPMPQRPISSLSPSYAPYILGNNPKPPASPGPDMYVQAHNPSAFASWVANILSGSGPAIGGSPAALDPQSTCFTSNVEVDTPEGPQSFGSFPAGTFTVLNGDGKEVRATLLTHDYDGEMIDMGHGLVTPEHHFQSGEDWVPAFSMFPNAPHVHYEGKVYNLHVMDESHNYRLANGHVAHNIIKAVE